MALVKREDTAGRWASADPVLADGEIAVETDTGRAKLGDGTTSYRDLDYIDDLVVRVLFATSKVDNDSGEMVFDGSSLHFTPVSDDRTVTLANGIVTESTSVANSTDETTLYTEEISAHELNPGKVVKVTVAGFFSTGNSSDTFTLRLKMGGSTILSASSVAANATDAPLRAEFTVTIRTAGESGSAIAYLSAIFDDEHGDAVETSAATVDTTVAEDITVTVQWSAEDPDNSLTLTQGYTELIG